MYSNAYNDDENMMKIKIVTKIKVATSRWKLGQRLRTIGESKQYFAHLVHFKGLLLFLLGLFQLLRMLFP